MTDISTLHDNLVRRVNVGDMLLRSVERFPEREMLVDGARRWSYRAFNRWTNQLAHGLASLGYGPGDRLALMAGNCAEFLATYFACAKLGVACVPINLLWGPNEIGYVLAHAKARGAVVEAPLLARLVAALPADGSVRDVVSMGEVPDAPLPAGVHASGFQALCAHQPDTEPEQVVANDAAVSILYTSGTTSAPKGVVASHLAICMDSLGTALDTGMSGSDRITAMLPLFHTAQLNALCTPAIAVGAGIVVLREFHAASLLDLIERERLSVVFGLPLMVRALCDAQEAQPRDLASLRLAVYAMAAMPQADLVRAMRLLGCEFSLMFGQTEMSPVATFFRPEHQLSHPGAVGTPATNVRVGIMDEHGGLLPAGATGEIVYRSPQLLNSYLDNPDATAEAFRHGWFHSGDAGHMDADGLLWFEDRFKDVIKSGGENVSSLEVEKAILATEPGIAEVAVVGLAHAHWTEAITAFALPRPGSALDTGAVLKRLRETLSAFKCPKDIVVLDALPKTATGKIQKAQLRAQYARHYDVGPAA
ncbi:AMP-binding protein [Hydrogenophaga sp.]|uniref:AMP-binding protein n=1 Tax=Hydrogenophaga sp. TaxID=1904254 RepID=UPI0035612ACF